MSQVKTPDEASPEEYFESLRLALYLIYKARGYISIEDIYELAESILNVSEVIIPVGSVSDNEKPNLDEIT